MLSIKIQKGMVMVNVIAACLIVVMLLSSLSIRLVRPQDGLHTTERRPELFWTGIQGDFIVLVDENPGFETPLMDEVSENSYKFADELDFGTYYWKVESGESESEVRSFTVDSSVMLERGDNEVSNAGNVEIILHRITGAFLLGTDDSLDIGEDEDVRAEQA